MEPIVERVVGQVLDSHAAQLRSEIVRRVMEEMEAQSATTTAASTWALPIWLTPSPRSNSGPRKGKSSALCSTPARVTLPESRCLW